MKGYGRTDEPVKQQQAIPACVLQDLCAVVSDDPAYKCAQQLFEFAFFWACRSCEYCDVQSPRKTKVLRGCDISFRPGNDHIRNDYPNIPPMGDAVTVKFQIQKNDDKRDAVTQFAVPNSKFCPHRVCKDILKRLHNCRLPASASIDHYRDRSGTLRRLSNKYMLYVLRRHIHQMNQRHPDNGLNLDPNCVGLHSARAAAAMAMYLNGVPPYTIMLIGRWKSMCFLKYIRKQVDMFSMDVSRRMLLNPRFSHPGTSTPKTRSRAPSSSKINELAISKNPFRNDTFAVWE